MIKKVLIMIACYSCLALFAKEIAFRDAEIVITKNPVTSALVAANELQYHLQKMTGGKFPIVKSRSQRYKYGIYVGMQDAVKKANLPIEKIQKDGFLRAVVGNDIYIVGDDDKKYGKQTFHHIHFFLHNKGTLNGAYDFLESLGVLWPIPGKANEYIPKKKVLKVAKNIKVDNPVFSERNAVGIHSFKRFPDAKEYTTNPQEVFNWAVRLRISNIRGIASGSHTEQFLQLDKIWFKKYPERFQLMKNNKRNPRYSCWSNPAIKEIWLKAADAYFSGKSPASIGLTHVKSWRGQNGFNEFMIDAMDHGSSNDGRCHCKDCKLFRKNNPNSDDTELYWQTIGFVAQQLEKKHPGKYITTLIYPPKSNYPKTIKLTSNIRVRVCCPGIKNVLLPNALKRDNDLIGQWSNLVGCKNIPLWTYQCENFARKLPGVPENYPYLAASYYSMMQGKIAGTRNEFTSPVFTSRLPDLYIQFKLLWNPNIDVKKTLHSYFNVMYGPAAKIMEDIYLTFEENFKKYYVAVTPNVPNPKDVGVARDGARLRNYAWSKIYTPSEMKKVTLMIDKAEALVKGKAPYESRIKVFRKWVWDIAIAERREVMQMEDMIPTLTLNKGKWSNTMQLLSAERLEKEIKNPSNFKMKYDDKNLYISIVAQEKEASKLKVNPKDELVNIWRDDSVEFFLYTQGNNTLRHAIFSTANRYIVQTITPKQQQWGPWNNLKYTMKSDATKRQIEITVPMDNEMKKGFKFNLVRSRKLKNVRNDEPYTWSEAAGLGNWFVTNSYGKIILK